MNQRVVVTGMGIVSCLGNDPETVAESLESGRSGIRHMPEFAAQGLKSCVGGAPEFGPLEAPRRYRRFMSDVGAYAYYTTEQAIADAALDAAVLTSPRTGVIAGSGTGSIDQHHAALETARLQGANRVSPFAVPQIMGSTVSAIIATAFGIQGRSYSITSACATSAHCIGHATELIRSGALDVAIAGGAEELKWTSALMFDAMGALATRCNNAPDSASCPYDIDRDGFVIAGGGGMLVLESLAHAQARGARIHGEIAGFGASSDGADMLTPSEEGAIRAMRGALAGVDAPPDYINTHATSTPAGDLVEVRAMQTLFGGALPPFSSTKGQTGHPIGASGVHEAIYCLLMMRDGFLAGCRNLRRPDAALDRLPLLRETRASKAVMALSNSFGFGGTNASLLLARPRELVS